MTQQILYILIMIASVLLSAIAQLFLKKAALRQYPNKLAEYFNPLVVFSYLLNFICVFVTVLAYRHVNLSLGPIVESLGYVFIAVFSFLFLHERIGIRKTLGFVLIIGGVLLAAL